MYVEYHFGDNDAVIVHDTEDATVSIEGTWLSPEGTKDFLKAATEISARIASPLPYALTTMVNNYHNRAGV